MNTLVVRADKQSKILSLQMKRSQYRLGMARPNSIREIEHNDHFISNSNGIKIC